MKTIFFLSIIILTLILVGCEKTIEASKLVERKDIHYQINTDKPFTGTVVSYHENGQVKISGKYKKGLKEDLFEEFYDNGQLLYSVNYFMGKKEGVENIYFRNGNIHIINNYKNNLLTGVKKTHYENGQVNLIEKYKGGIIEDFSRFSISGDEYLIISEGFNDDWEFIISKNSDVVIKIDDTVIREGEVRWGLDEVIQYLKRTTGEPFTGFVFSYHNNEKLDSRVYVKNGFEHGLFEIFYENGGISSRVNMYEGKFEGSYETFYENGTLESVDHYSNNKRVGLAKNFFEDGTLFEKTCYQNDEEVEMSFCDEK